jgi:hypothetical protein
MLLVGPSPVTPVQAFGAGVAARPAYTDDRVSPHVGDCTATGPAAAAGAVRLRSGGGGASGAGGPAAEAEFSWEVGSNPNPSGGILHHDGKLYISDTEAHRIRVMDLATGVIEAFAGTGEKALAFTRMLANVDYAASKTMVETAVTNNPFTTQTVNSKDSLYIIDVDADDLDVAGGFDCVRVDGTGHAATASRGCVVLYQLYGARYSGMNPAID